jgi:hypothetical protein
MQTSSPTRCGFESVLVGIIHGISLRVEIYQRVDLSVAYNDWVLNGGGYDGGLFVLRSVLACVPASCISYSNFRPLTCLDT